MQEVLIKSNKLIVPVLGFGSNGSVKVKTHQGERWFRAQDVTYDLSGGRVMQPSPQPSAKSGDANDIEIPTVKNESKKHEELGDAKLLLLFESRKKSGMVAALLNLFLPGAGYIYCGEWSAGVLAFVFVVALIILSFGVAVIPLGLVLVLDGFLSASRHNKKLINKMLSSS